MAILRSVTESLISPEVAAVLEKHGISAEPRFLTLDCDPIVSNLEEHAGPDSVMRVASASEILIALRTHRICGVFVGRSRASELVDALQREGVSAGVVVYDPSPEEASLASLRSRGVMEVLTSSSTIPWPALLRRIIDFRALLVLELQHRCEAKRLSERELTLLGTPPESMSDDLTTHQPPPLPVGPMSVYDLDEASESFETAYIDRVQQLCASAREAAEYLGVSSATLSRRLRREVPHGA